eukprot:COSAG02_NODE_11_length_58539_cov_103.119473_12_plen_1074_part_00
MGSVAARPGTGTGGRTPPAHARKAARTVSGQAFSSLRVDMEAPIKTEQPETHTSTRTTSSASASASSSSSSDDNDGASQVAIQAGRGLHDRALRGMGGRGREKAYLDSFMQATHLLSAGQVVPRPETLLDDQIRPNLWFLENNPKSAARRKGTDRWIISGGRKGSSQVWLTDTSGVRKRYGCVVRTQGQTLKYAQFNRVTRVARCAEVVEDSNMTTWMVLPPESMKLKPTAFSASGRNTDQAVLGLKLSSSTARRFISFESAEPDEDGMEMGAVVRHQDEGVQLLSHNGDFAEWHRCAPGEAPFFEGEVVGFRRNGLVSRKTRGAPMVGIITRQAVVEGSAPAQAERHNFETVAYSGVVPVRLARDSHDTRSKRSPTVHPGQLLSPSGNDDGLAVLCLATASVTRVGVLLDNLELEHGANLDGGDFKSPRGFVMVNAVVVTPAETVRAGSLRADLVYRLAVGLMWLIAVVSVLVYAFVQHRGSPRKPVALASASTSAAGTPSSVWLGCDGVACRDGETYRLGPAVDADDGSETFSVQCAASECTPAQCCRENKCGVSQRLTSNAIRSQAAVPFGEPKFTQSYTETTGSGPCATGGDLDSATLALAWEREVSSATGGQLYNASRDASAVSVTISSRSATGRCLRLAASWQFEDAIAYCQGICSSTELCSGISIRPLAAGGGHDCCLRARWPDLNGATHSKVARCFVKQQEEGNVQQTNHFWLCGDVSNGQCVLSATPHGYDMNVPPTAGGAMMSISTLGQISCATGFSVMSAAESTDSGFDDGHLPTAFCPFDGGALMLSGCVENQCTMPPAEVVVVANKRSGTMFVASDFMVGFESVEAAYEAFVDGALEGTRFVVENPHAETVSSVGAVGCALGYGTSTRSLKAIQGKDQGENPRVLASLPSVSCDNPHRSFNFTGCYPQDSCEALHGKGGDQNSPCALIASQYRGSIQGLSRMEQGGFLGRFQTDCQAQSGCQWVEPPQMLPKDTAWVGCVLAPNCTAAQIDFGDSVLQNRRNCVRISGCQYCVQESRLPLLDGSLIAGNAVSARLSIQESGGVATSETMQSVEAKYCVRT